MSSDEAKKQFEHWCIIDLFGHTRIAGLVTEQTIGGCAFVRVDVPETPKAVAFTRLLGNGAIYSINFVTEEVARQFAVYSTPLPVQEYEIPALRQKQLALAQEADDCDIPFDPPEEM